MVSSKYLTAFSDFRIPADAPDFISPMAYMQYIEDYVDKFKLRPFITCSAKVTAVTRNGRGHRIMVHKEGGQSFEWDCDAIAVCSGLHVEPSIPKIPGIENVPHVLHSSQVKTREQFGRDTVVMVLGAGETGMDMAHLAVTSPTKSVVMCHREGFSIAPKASSRWHQRAQKHAGLTQQDGRSCLSQSCWAFTENRRMLRGRSRTSRSTRRLRASSIPRMCRRSSSVASYCGNSMTSGSRRCTS
jgi:cation diffusion facilitator CzcD-associated flavoprotein CzcO